MNPLDLPSSLSMKRPRLSIDNTVYVVDFTFSSTDWRLTSSHIGFSITQSVRAWFPLILQMRCPPFCTIYTLILHWLCILSAMTIVLSRSIFCCSLDAASISFSHDRIHRPFLSLACRRTYCIEEGRSNSFVNSHGESPRQPSNLLLETFYVSMWDSTWIVFYYDNSDFKLTQLCTTSNLCPKAFWRPTEFHW